MNLLRRGLFHGRFRKLKYAGLLLLLIAACIATMGMLFFTSMTSTAQYEVSGLKVEQDGTGLEISWDPTDADVYEVFLQQNGEWPKRYLVDENRCRIDLDVLDQEYRVTVTARNNHGGLSAAESRNLMTQKLDQTIETEKEKYVGLKDKERNIEAEAHGKITYTTSNPAIVTVTKDGILQFKKDGKAEVSIHVAEGDQYNAADKTVPVTVYPDQLDTPEMKLGKVTDTDAVLRWDPVQYAKGYTLRKYSPAKDKYYDLMDFTGGR